MEESRFPKLISLLDKGQRVQPGILGSAIRSEFKNIEKARHLGISWDEIADSLGFTGKGKLASASYSRERRRQEQKGEAKELTKTVSAPGLVVQNVPVQKTENRSENPVKPRVHLLEDKKGGTLFDQRPLF